MAYHVKTTLLALATALPTHVLADWNGVHAGLSLGANTINEISGDFEESEADSSTAFGVFGGYAIQNNDFVFGGEVAFLRAPDLEFDIDGNVYSPDFDILDLKGRAGYALNNILFYGVAGVSRISESENDDNANGFNFGVGADYDLGNNIVIGANYLARRTKVDVDDDVDVNLDTFAFRTALRF